MPLRGLIDLFVRSFFLTIDGKYRADRQHFQHQARLHAVRPQLAREIGLLDFRHSTELEVGPIWGALKIRTFSYAKLWRKLDVKC